jgi:hypothetical protein
VPPTHPRQELERKTLLHGNLQRGKGKHRPFRETRCPEVCRRPAEAAPSSCPQGWRSPAFRSGLNDHPQDGHRNQKGLRCRQTPLRRSGFPHRETQPRRESMEDSGCAGGPVAGSSRGRTGSQPPVIGPPSQQVSRIAPHCRQMSFARISWVSPEQIGQRVDDMVASIRPPCQDRKDLRWAKSGDLPVGFSRLARKVCSTPTSPCSPTGMSRTTVKAGLKGRRT